MVHFYSNHHWLSSFLPHDRGFLSKSAELRVLWSPPCHGCSEGWLWEGVRWKAPKMPLFFLGGGKFISNVQPQAHTVCVLRLFSRLWCIFELAAFRKANPNGRIVLAPLILGGSRFCRSCILYNDRGSGNGSSMVVVDGSSKFLSYPRDGA